MRATGGQRQLVKIEPRARHIKVHMEVVDQRGVGAILNAALAIAKISVIAGPAIVEAGVYVEILKFRIQHALFVVVINLSLIQDKLLYGQLKEAGVAAALLLGLWQIVFPSLIHENVRYRMIDDDVLQTPRATHQRKNLYSNIDVISLQQRLTGISFTAMDGDAIKIQTEITQMQAEIPHLQSCSRGLRHDALHPGQNALPKSLVALHQQDARNHRDDDHNQNSCDAPGGDFFPVRFFLRIRFLRMHGTPLQNA